LRVACHYPTLPRDGTDCIRRLLRVACHYPTLPRDGTDCHPALVECCERSTGHHRNLWILTSFGGAS